MTYIKLLTALTALALLTACGGAAAPADKTGGDTTSDDPCVTNPFGTTCTNPTETQRVTFCRDASKTTDTKTDDCAPTVFSVCDANAFDTLCPDDAVKEEAFCRDTAKSTGTKANDCAPIVKTTCMADFFDTLCDDITEYEDKRTEFNNACINDPAKSQSVCEMEALVRTCGADPFATGCEAGYAPNRKTTCASEITSTRCIPTVTLFCGTDSKVFDTYCTAPAHVDKRIDLCLTGDTNRLCPGSAGITNTFCTANPFDPRAGCMADAYNMARQTACESGDKDRMECAPTVLRICDVPNGFRNDFCRGLQRYDDLNNMNPDPCANGGCVEYADWLASFTGGDALPTTPDATTRKNQFLQATTTGFASGANAGIRQNFGEPDTDIAIQTLTFNNAATATGGMAFFGGELYTAGTSTGNNFYYAGILAGTDLGAPITETITTAVKWRGQIRAVASNLLAQLDAGEIADFELDITFDGAKGTITTSFALGTSFIYEIDGVFDENGIITGSVDYGAGDTTNGINMTAFAAFYSPGTLTGIIGQNGAVGAFHSGRVGVTAGADGPSFSGGFIALPPSPCQVADTCVNTADWLASFTGNDALPTIPDATTRKNQFLQATTTGFNTGANADIRTTISNPLPVTDIAIETLTFDNTATATGGAAFFGGELYTDGMRVANTYYHYAGILARTNLGAPITEIITTAARWTGQIRAVASESVGTLTANPTAGFGVDITFDGTGGTMKTIFANSGFLYSIDGRFDDKGIIEGDVAFGQPLGVGDVRSVDTSDSSYSPGTLTGIIGQNGAVGVFHSDNDNSATGGNPFVYSGGFVARPKP